MSPAPEEFVDLLYRGVLGRAPDEIGRALHAEKLRSGLSALDLIRLFIGSDEFRQNHLLSQSRRAFVPLGAPEMKVECRASAAELSRFIERTGNAWTAMGTSRPYHSVLTQEHYRPENITDKAIGNFWASGAAEVGTNEAILARNGFQDASSKICVEYGCGLGRVTIALAKKFKRVHAYDISPTHLEAAKGRAAQLGVKNIEFHLCSADIFQKKLVKSDFFYSRIVFQHNPPPIIRELIALALESLKAGAIAIFQVPTYAMNYTFRIQEYLAQKSSSDMEMHFLPQSEIFQLSADAKCQLLEVLEDGSTGNVGSWISNTFVVKRPS